MKCILNFCVLVVLLTAQESVSQKCELKPVPNGQKCTSDSSNCPKNHHCVLDKNSNEGTCRHVCAGFIGISCPTGLTCCFDNDGVYKPEPPPFTADYQGICL